MSIGFPCTQQQANVILNHSLQPLLSDSAHQPISCTSLVRPSWHRLSPFAYASPERPPRNCHGPRGSPARNCWGPPATEPQITKTIRKKKGNKPDFSHPSRSFSEAFPRVFALIPPLKGHRQCPVPGPGPQFPGFLAPRLLHARAAAAHLGEGRCAAGRHRAAAGGGRPRRRVLGRRRLRKGWSRGVGRG